MTAPVDALFIINQYTAPETLRTASRDGGYRSVTVLSTHRPFPNERMAAVDIAEKVSWFTFSDLADDALLAACDAAASQAVAAGAPSLLHTPAYLSRFISESLRQKNASVYRRLLKQIQPRRLHHDHGLGIHGGFWNSQGSRPLPIPLRRRRDIAAVLLKRRLTRLWQPRWLHRFIDGNTCYLIPGEKGRLRIDPLIVLEAWPLPRLDWLIFTRCGPRAAPRIARRISETVPPGKRVICVCTLHGYGHFLDQLSYPLYIVTDGYLPSNYPRSYLDAYPAATFVPLDPFGRRWLMDMGRRTAQPLPFLAVPRMSPAVAPVRDRRQTVVVTLNHAGDWSALINRSDTDALVEAVADAAEHLPEITFVIRPHPTMDAPEHEGIGARERIARYVRWRALANLQVSNDSIQADLNRADLLVSEYSQVLIDGFHLGTLGLIANMTHRRSFMTDFEALGFASADNPRRLRQRIADIFADLPSAAMRQSAAADRYNRELQRCGL